jgi:hypothetical protein
MGYKFLFVYKGTHTWRLALVYMLQKLFLTSQLTNVKRENLCTPIYY